MSKLHSHNQMQESSISDKNETKLPTITMDNVHTLSTYELRQELKSKGICFEKKDHTINYQFLLKEMVKWIQLEKKKKDEARMNDLEQKSKDVEDNHSKSRSYSSLQEKLSMEKEERKAEALERSRLRQLDKNYFQLKKQAYVCNSNLEITKKK